MESTLREYNFELPAKAKFGVFCRQHLATLATPTIRSNKRKQSPVYGVFDRYFLMLMLRKKYMKKTFKNENSQK